MILIFHIVRIGLIQYYPQLRLQISFDFFYIIEKSIYIFFIYFGYWNILWIIFSNIQPAHYIEYSM